MKLTWTFGSGELYYGKIVVMFGSLCVHSHRQKRNSLHNFIMIFHIKYIILSRKTAADKFSSSGNKKICYFSSFCITSYKNILHITEVIIPWWILLHFFNRKRLELNIIETKCKIYTQLRNKRLCSIWTEGATPFCTNF